jgi:hypothetical protein
MSKLQRIEREIAQLKAYLLGSMSSEARKYAEDLLFAKEFYLSRQTQHQQDHVDKMLGQLDKVIYDYAAEKGRA